MKDILYSAQKVNKDGKNANLLVAYHSSLACKLLKKFSYNFYHIIFIVDPNMHLIGSITETQLIDGITKYGNKVILNDLI